MAVVKPTALCQAPAPGRRPRAPCLLGGALLVSGALVAAEPPVPAAAQDVEMLARRYGTRPPPAYYRALALEPEAFRFRHGRALRLRLEAAQRALLRPGAPGGAAGGSTPGTPLRGSESDAVRGSSAPAAAAPGTGAGGASAVGRSGSAADGTEGSPAGARLALGPRGGPVVGTFHLPVLLGLFDDSPSQPFSRAMIESAYFADFPGTVRRYYEEVSLGKVTLLGEVQDWVSSPLTRAQVTNGNSGLQDSRIGDFITDLLEAVQAQGTVDWRLYDNDGPDGDPDSGDDDGYVDALAVIHPTVGAECSSAAERPHRIWSHKWNLTDAGAGAFDTGTASASPETTTILVDDYFIQGARSCEAANQLNEIGVFTHETGHAFGLPDLYDTRSVERHAGAGTWDLMSAGSWGCDDRTPASPCHMGAWSKAVLGWVDVTTLPADAALQPLTLPPVETSGTVYRVDAADGSGEYFLLENRQSLASGFDQNLYGGGGLLVWHIDPAAVAARWDDNLVNGDARMAVWLRQADGLNDLGTQPRPRGDAGDPFPFGVGGPDENRVFHATSNPAALSRLGTPTGLTVLDITRVAGDAVEFELLTGFTTVSVRADGQEGTDGLFTVDGAPVDPSTNSYTAAPFMEHLVEAAPAENVGPGERIPFVEWVDSAQLPRSRVIVTPTQDIEYVARYTGREYRLAVELTGGVNGVSPGTIASTPASPDLWFPATASVSLLATPRTGFDFRAWTGALAAEPNPATVTMSGPLSAGADFDLVYAVASADVVFPATIQQNVRLEIESGTPPVRWRLVDGELPAGINLSEGGRITGAAIDLGTFPLVLEATDALGLTATGTVTLDVEAPMISIRRLTSFFLLSGVEMDPVEMAFLDRQANRDGGYDLGDFRAWVLAHPTLPMSARIETGAGRAAPRTLVVPMRAVEPAPETTGEARTDPRRGPGGR